MRVIVIIDNKGGMMFNHRRQSQDQVLRRKILSLTKGKKLWMNEYSYQQFQQDCTGETIKQAEDFLNRAGEEEYCFAEGQALRPFLDKITELIVFRWNRDYPGDVFLDLDMSDGSWKLLHMEEFPGFSHEKITLEVYKHER